jgi:hypothetical protein
MDERLADAYFPLDPPMKKRLRLAHSALWLTLLALLAARAGADAIVWSRAMLAPTIAEYYVEPGRLRVDLEIGVEDLDAFRNLMPDEIYERLGHPPEPFAERLGRFYANDFAIAPEGGEPLRARASAPDATRSPASPCPRKRAKIWRRWCSPVSSTSFPSGPPPSRSRACAGRRWPAWASSSTTRASRSTTSAI